MFRGIFHSVGMRGLNRKNTETSVCLEEYSTVYACVG